MRIQPKVVERGTYRQRWVPCEHEDKVYIKHEHTQEKQFYERVKQLRRVNHRVLEWARSVCEVPSPPTDHYAMCVNKYGLEDPDELTRRNNVIRWLKSTDGEPYRIVPKHRI